ncbi:MAG: hypothetical protein CSA58_11805, partial [Micrococcales bacterium]
MKTTTTRSIAVSAALALCLGVGAFAANAAAGPGWSSGTGFITSADVTTTSYGTFVQVNNSKPVKGRNGQTIMVRYPQGIDVSKASVKVVGSSAASAKVNAATRTVSFTASDDLGAETNEPVLVLVKDLKASWGGTVNSSFRLLTTADTPYVEELSTALDLTVVLASSTLTASQSTVTLPALDPSLSAPAWNTFTAGEALIT